MNLRSPIYPSLILLTLLSLTTCLLAEPPATNPLPALSTPPTTNNAPTPQNAILIGHVASLTGIHASFGFSTQKGIALALDDLNQKGLLNKKIILIANDDHSSSTQASSVAQALIDNEHCIALLGEVASSASIQAAAIAQDRKIPMISPSSTSPQVTRIGNFIFRACFLDSSQGPAIAKFAIDTLHAKTFAILYDKGSAYSQILHDNFTAYAQSHNAAIVADTSYAESSDKDFTQQLAKIQAQNPDAIYLPGYYNNVAIIIHQARTRGITAPILGCDGWVGPDVYANADSNCYYTNHFSLDDPRPQVQAFVYAYHKKYDNEDPDAMAALAYDATNLLANAIQSANSTDPQKIRDALANTKNFPAVTGPISFDQDRNPLKPLLIESIQNNKPHFITQIPPEDLSPTPATLP